MDQITQGDRQTVSRVIAAYFEANGGGTVRLCDSLTAGEFTAERISAGYAVGGAGVSWVKREPFTAEEVRAFLWEQDLWTEVIGAWRDDSTGKWWLDAVTVHEYASDASLTASERGEIAFWDFAEAREVRLADCK